MLGGVFWVRGIFVGKFYSMVGCSVGIRLGVVLFRVFVFFGILVVSIVCLSEEL